MIEARLKKSFTGKAESAPFTLDIDLQAFEGITVLFGPSGAGKTLTLDLIAGFAEADEGRVVLDGEDITRLPARRRRTGYVFQNYALFPHMTLRQNLEFVEKGKRVDELLERFRLTDVAGRKPHQLSGGQKQRGSIARALVGQPRLLLLDEPTRGLDAPLRQEFYQTLQEIQTPILLVTHGLDECYALGRLMHVMHGGRIVQSGVPVGLAEGPASVEVARLLGTYNVLSPSEVIQYKHVQVQPAADGVAVRHVYRQPNGVLVEFENGVRAELPAIDETVKSWRLHFPIHNVLKLDN